MRETKFRAWDTENQLMVYDSNDTLCDVVMNLNGSLWCPDSYYMGCEKNYILMQYTGLQDKNGKEIWEVDIVRTLGLMDNIVGKVQFSSRIGWQIHPPDWATDLGYSLYEVRAFTEVIGDIYSNPELLEK